LGSSVNLDVFVHHGQSKALIPMELQEKDIVLTTYGTLMSEFKDNPGPLLRAKWLRVVLDEGHQVLTKATAGTH
jgi:SNF2 family DNA or RNA helicase